MKNTAFLREVNKAAEKAAEDKAVEDKAVADKVVADKVADKAADKIPHKCGYLRPRDLFAYDSSGKKEE